MEDDPAEYDCMELPVRILRFFGSWPHWNRMNEWSEKIYLCYMSFLLYVLVSNVAILTYSLVKASASGTWSSVDAALEDIFVYATAVVTLIKMLVIIRHQGSLQRLIDYINNCLNKKWIKREEERKEIVLCVKHERKLVKCYTGAAIALFLLYMTSSVGNIFKSRFDILNEILPLKYPFTITDFPTFLIICVHQILVIATSTQVGMLMDMLFSCLAYHLCGHLKIAKNRVLSQGYRIARSSIEYHCEIIRLSKTVEGIFEKYLFFMFSTNSALICLALLQVTQIADIRPFHYARCFLYLGIKLTQIFLYCWYGQEVIQRSSEMGFACYSTRWYEGLWDGDLLNLRFVLLRSQKPLKMKACSIFVISIATLKKVMNSAYSYFTMLSSFRK